MKKLLWSCAALLTLFVTVESLMCYKCDVNILGGCFLNTPVNCTESQTMCYYGVATFSYDLLSIHARGCIASSQCVNVTNQSILAVTYNITRSCCSSDLCNGAATIQTPLTVALGAALMAIWSQWGL